MEKSVLPVVSQEIVADYKHSFDEDPKEKLIRELETLRTENPFLYEVVDHLGDRHGQNKAASLCLVLTVYSLLRQQAEVDELEKQNT